MEVFEPDQLRVKVYVYNSATACCNFLLSTVVKEWKKTKETDHRWQIRNQYRSLLANMQFLNGLILINWKLIMVMFSTSEYLKYTEPLKNSLEGSLPCLPACSCEIRGNCFILDSEVSRMERRTARKTVRMKSHTCHREKACYFPLISFLFLSPPLPLCSSALLREEWWHFPLVFQFSTIGGRTSIG